MNSVLESHLVAVVSASCHRFHFTISSPQNPVRGALMVPTITFTTQLLDAIILPILQTLFKSLMSEKLCVSSWAERVGVRIILLYYVLQTHTAWIFLCLLKKKKSKKLGFSFAFLVFYHFHPDSLQLWVHPAFILFLILRYWILLEKVRKWGNYPNLQCGSLTLPLNPKWL